MTEDEGSTMPQAISAPSYLLAKVHPRSIRQEV
jgi:hypothetical protein